MGVNFENNRDLAKQIAGQQYDVSNRQTDALNVLNNLNTRYPVLGTNPPVRRLSTADEVERKIMRDEKEGLTFRVKELTEKVAEKDKVIAQLTAEKKELETRNNELASKVASRERTVTQLTSENQLLQQRNNGLTSKVNELTSTTVVQQKTGEVKIGESTVFDLKRGKEVIRRHEIQRPNLLLTFKDLLRGIESIKEEEKLRVGVPKPKPRSFLEEIKVFIHW